MEAFLVPFLFLLICIVLAGFLHGLYHLAPVISKHFLLEHEKSVFYYTYHTRLFAPYEVPILRSVALVSLGLFTLIFGIVFVLCTSHLLLANEYFDFSLDLAFFLFLYLFSLGTLDAIAARFAKKLLLICGPIASPFLFLTLFLCYPCFKWQQKAHALDAEAPDQQNHMEEILEAFQDPSSTETMDPSEYKLIGAALSLKDTKVREVMVPRVNLFALEASTPISKAALLSHEEGYSRIPVYKNDLDHIVGILMVKDLVELFAKKESGQLSSKDLEGPIESLVKKPLYTPESKGVSQLLQDFRTKQTHLAIVVDEYGGTKGVVTIEDILEEIVGEIEDEYDEADIDLIKSLPSGGWVVSATISIADLEERLHIHLPYRNEYDTLGGYIFHTSGTIPKKGFVIQNDDFSLEIVSSDERKIQTVKITPHDKK